MKDINIGIIGCGVISNTYIKDISRLYPMIHIAKVADVDVCKAKETAEKYNIAEYSDVDGLLNDPNISMIVNLTPPKFHVELNEKILNSGKHLFCEKPFALNIEDAIRIKELAESKGLLIGCAPDSFMGSSLRTCKKILNDGWIGKPLYACVNMMTRGVETWHPVPENFYKFGGGPLYDMGGYYFTALVNFFGPVESVFATSAKGFEERTIYTGERFGTTFSVDVPTHYSAIVNFKSGITVNANFSFDIWKTNMPLFEVYGTDGTLMVPDPNMHGGTPKVYRKEQTLAANFSNESAVSVKEYEIPELYQNVGTYIRCLGVADLVEAICEGTRIEANVELAIHVLDIITGIMKSSDSHEPYFLTTTY